jgi:hypothetical protein
MPVLIRNAISEYTDSTTMNHVRLDATYTDSGIKPSSWYMSTAMTIAAPTMKKSHFIANKASVTACLIHEPCVKTTLIPKTFHSTN